LFDILKIKDVLRRLFGLVRPLRFKAVNLGLNENRVLLGNLPEAIRPGTLQPKIRGVYWAHSLFQLIETMCKATKLQ
jgi:hypothetical protein